MTKLFKKYTDLFVICLIAMLSMIFMLSITDDFFLNMIFLFLFTFSVFAFFLFGKETKIIYKHTILIIDFMFIYLILVFEDFYVSLYIICFIMPLFFVMEKNIKIIQNAIITNCILFIISNFYILLNKQGNLEFYLFLESNFFMNMTLFLILNITYLRVFKQKFNTDSLLEKEILEHQREMESLKYSSFTKNSHSKNSTDSIFKLKFYLNSQKQISQELLVVNDKIKRYTIENLENKTNIDSALKQVEDNLRRNTKELMHQAALFQEIRKEMRQEDIIDREDIGKLENINFLNISTSETMNDVVNSVSNIQLSIENIKNVSNQINLLSLNASIESSKLGETGKSFSIISKEIKHLQENISEIINIVNSDIHSIQRSYNHSKENINIIIKDTEFLLNEHRSLNKELAKKGNLLGEISSSQSNITQELDEISESFSELIKHNPTKSANVIELIEENNIQHKLTLRNIDAILESLEQLNSSLRKS